MRRGRFALLAALLTACSHGTAQLASHPVVPAGVVLPPEAREGALVDGILIGRSSQGSCCWIATAATLLLRKPGAAKHLALVIYVPKHGHAATALTIEARIEGATEQRCCFRDGVNAVRFDLPRSLWSKSGTVAVRLRSTHPFVRNLAFVLMRTVFY